MIVHRQDDRIEILSHVNRCGHLPDVEVALQVVLPFVQNELFVSGHSRQPTVTLLTRIDEHSRVGLQTQIYSAVRRAILDGTVTPGTRLSSSRALARDLCVSRTTTLLAYEQLASEGYLSGCRGSGTFVAEVLPDEPPRTRLPAGTRTKHAPLSRRGRALAASPSPSRRIQGPPRPFRIGVPGLDLFPLRLWSQLVGRRLRSMSLRQLDYTDAAGMPELREAIAGHVRAARGTSATADQVLVVAGAQRGIELACRMLLDPGDKAWLEEPGYPGARSALAAADARIVPVPVDEFGLDVEAGMRRARDARLAYVTPSHQFPLGVPMSLPRRLALLQWASTSGAWVIEDDYDSEFRYGVRPIQCLHGLDADGRVIYAGSFSKTLFPALRLGFLLVPSDVREPLLAARRAADVHPPLLEQAVLADFIERGHFERHLRRMRAAYAERLDAVVDAADRSCRGMLALRPAHTGLHVVADLNGVDAEVVCEEAVTRGVEVTPLTPYCVRPLRAPDALVLGFAVARPEAIRSGMDRLAAAIEAARRAGRQRAAAGGVSGG
jgi:GntR family transcriptional regulator / MocR family aminotransferase